MVSRLTNLVYYDLQDIQDGDPRKLEAVIDKYKKLMHPNHFHMIGIKHTLSQVLYANKIDCQMLRVCGV